MTKVRLRSVNDNWGGILNLSLGSTMTEEECLEIVKKLEDISQNKFYTINIYDKLYEKFIGDAELLYKVGSHFTILNTAINNTQEVVRFKYVFYTDGKYARERTNYGSIKDILQRLETIENKLNEITTEL